jgi:hypothetical protein
MSDVMFAVVTELPELPDPKVNPVLPELKVNPALREVKAQRVLRALRALMARQARREPLGDVALPERRVLKARPALRGLKALKVAPETANQTTAVALDIPGRDMEVTDQEPDQNRAIGIEQPAGFLQPGQGVGLPYPRSLASIK